MKVRHIWAGGNSYTAGKIEEREVEGALLELMNGAVLSNTATLVVKEDHGSFDVLGTATDGSLLIMAAEVGILDRIKDGAKVLEEFSLDKKEKLLSAVCEVGNTIKAYVRGAPERVLERSVSYLEHGRVQPLTDEKRESLKKTFEEYVNVFETGFFSSTNIFSFLNLAIKSLKETIISTETILKVLI